MRAAVNFSTLIFICELLHTAGGISRHFALSSLSYRIAIISLTALTECCAQDMSPITSNIWRPYRIRNGEGPPPNSAIYIGKHRFLSSKTGFISLHFEIYEGFRVTSLRGDPPTYMKVIRLLYVDLRFLRGIRHNVQNKIAIRENYVRPIVLKFNGGSLLVWFGASLNGADIINH